MIIGDMEIRLRADIARLQRDMDDARRVVGGAVNGIAEMAKMARGALIGMAAGISFAALVHQVVDAQREFDKLNASLITATGSTANAVVAFKALQSFAATTPYSVQEATEAFIKMRNLGLDPSERALRSYGNTAAAMGKGLNQMVEAVADAATGEFERLKEFGITAKQNGDRVALTFKGMTANIGNNAKEIQEYLRKIGETDFGGGMELRAATLDGAISNLGDTWQSVLRTISSNGIGEAMLSGVLAVSGALQDLSAILDAVGGAASKEGTAVKEATGVHAILTATFEALAVVGTNIAYVFQTIGKDIGAFAAQAVMLFNGGFKGLMDGSTLQQVQDIGRARVAEAEQERKAVDEKSAAIVGASEKARIAQAKEADERKKNGQDVLGGMGIVLTAEQKQQKALSDTLELRNRLNGVNAQTAGELAKLKTALDTGAISQAEYNRYVAQVNKDARENSTVYKNAVKQIDLQTSALQRQAAARAFDNQQAQLQIDFLKRTGQLNDEDAINKSADTDLKALREQRDALETQKKLQAGKIDNLAKVKELQGQIDQVGRDADARELKRGNDLFELDQKRYREAAGNYADLLEAAQAQSKAQQDTVRDGQDEIEMLGMTSKEIAEVTAARLRDRAALLDQWATVQDLQDDTKRLGDESRKQAESLRALADQALLKDELTRQKELWGQIENTAHDTFISIFDSGKSAFDRLRDTLKNGLLELLYQMTIKKWVFNIGASVGMTGYGSAAQAASLAGGSSATTGSTSSVINAAQVASSLYKAVSGGFETLSTSVADAVQAGMYQSGMTTQIASNGSFASGAGSATSVAAGMIGGHYLGNAISNGYGIGDHEQAVNNTGVAAGTGIGYYVGGMAGAALGALIGGAAGGFLNRIFGMGDKETSSQGIRGTLSASSLSGESYANWHQDGGWFRSDKDGTDVKALTDAMVKQFTSGLATIEMVSAGFATSLGVQADSIKDYSKVFDLKLTGDATKDQQLVTEFFSGISDEIANKLVPNLADFAKSGEAASATLERLAGDFKGTDEVAQLLGSSADKLFGSSGLQSAAAREQLIGVAGGLSVLSQQAAFFNQNFLTDAERIKPVAEALDKALASLGLDTIPTTRDQFKGLVNSLIVSGAAATESGAKQLESLLALGEAFAQVHPDDTTAAAEKAAKILQERQGLQDEYDQMALTSTQLLVKQRDKLEESNRALFDQVQALKLQTAAIEEAKARATGLLGDVDGAFSVLQKVVDREKATVQTVVNTHTAAVTKLQSLSQSLRSTLDSLKSPDQKLAERAVGQAQIRAALAIAKAGGPLPNSDDLQDALRAVTQDATSQFSSYTDYLRDLYQTQNDIAQLGDLADDQLSVEQKALQAAQDQLDRLDTIVANGQAQVDAINGQSVATLSLAQAIAGLQTSLGSAQANPYVSATSSITDAYMQLLGRAPDAAGLAYWQQAAAGGVSIAQIRALIEDSAEYKKLKGVPGFAAGGDFGGGVRLVGEVGAELEATGPARIHSTRALVDALRSPSSNNDALVAEVRALRVEVSELRKVSTQTAQNTRRHADMFDNATGGGNLPMPVEVVQ